MKFELTKPSSVIHISHTISQLQQQLWNFLLAHAYNNAYKKVIHQISMMDILKFLGNTRNRTYVETALSALTDISTNIIFNKDSENSLDSFNFLGDVFFSDGKCFYSYGEQLRELLTAPRCYAKINLLTQRKLRSKYSSILYELFLDYAILGTTHWMSISQFRTFIGLNEFEYPLFRNLNEHVIKKALLEINTKTELEVTVENLKKGTRITNLRFFVKVHDTAEKEIFVCPVAVVKTTIPHYSRVTAELLKKFGVVEVQAEKLSQIYSYEQVKEKIELLKNSKSNINNTSAWLVSALKNNWAKKDYALSKSEPVERNLQSPNSSAKPVNESSEKELANRRLQHEHKDYINLKAQNIFDRMSLEENEKFELEFQSWLKDQAFPGFLLNDLHFSRLGIIARKYISEDERNFERWKLLKIKGHEIQA